MRSHSLRKFLGTYPDGLPEISFGDVIMDSRMVKPGDLFVALRGGKTDGRRYIFQALSRGAVAVLKGTEREDPHAGYDLLNIGGNYLPVLEVHQLERKLSTLAGNLYSHPSGDLCLIGVTGTNGKTTVSHLMMQWMAALGIPSGVVGTLGSSSSGVLMSPGETTRSSVENQRILADLLAQGVTFVAMEVSSHGLAQHRVDGLHFTAAVFTSFGRDHLDYHHDLDRYRSAKFRLFADLISEHQVINVSDETGFRWMRDLPGAMVVSLHPRRIPADRQADWLYLDRVRYCQHGTSIHFRSNLGCGDLSTRLIGKFNVVNVLLALATLLKLGQPLELLCRSAGMLEPIVGRMELITAPGGPKVLVDYAHNPEALLSALVSSRMYCRKVLWCIFGCGGNRDRGKRKLMGSIAERYADKVVITSDNPREEDVDEIADDIRSGMTDPGSAPVIQDRREAIGWVVRQSSADDVILIAGKGHEVSQITCQGSVHHSDREVISDLLGVKCGGRASTQ